MAKIYSTPPDHKKAQKLLVMAQAAIPSLLKIAAWPIDLLTDSKGALRGFIMPRVIARRDIHELYGPKSRSESFPEADFRFLVHVGANIARAFAVIHEQGHVVGDVNHGNLLVASDGTVMLIDCDSFQIRNEAICRIASGLYDHYRAVLSQELFRLWSGVIFRSVSPRYATPVDIVSGYGSYRAGGRWNEPGI